MTSGTVSELNRTVEIGDSSGDSGSIGIGFAIPIDTARSIAESLLAHAPTTG